MTTEPDVYTTIGHECGCCGHRHRSVWEAGQCLAEHHRQQQCSDRRVVAVAADAPWRPIESRDLNDAELHDFYADARPGGSDDHWARATFAAGVAADVAAVRCVADALHNAWAEGGLGRDSTEDAEVAAAGCRVIGLALATVERAADSHCAGREWSC